LFLVVLGTVVAAFAGRLSIPAPSLLVIAGLVVGLVPGVPAVHVPPDVVSLVVLPPLLYAASEELSWRDLLTVWRPVLVLAVGLVLASAAAVAAVAGAVAAIPASMAFVLGSVLAAVAGILYGLSYPKIDPLMGIMPGLKAFIAAVLGGIGNVPGAVVGGLIIGIIESFVGGSQFSNYRDAIAFIILIAILLFRPSGLFGKYQAEKV